MSGSDIKVEGEPIEIPAREDKETTGDVTELSRAIPAGGSASEQPVGAEDFDYEKFNGYLLEASFMMINGILEASGYEPCMLDDTEQEKLEILWKPYLPNMPKWVYPVVGTVMIVGPKAAMLMKMREEKRKGVKHDGVPDKGS